MLQKQNKDQWLHGETDSKVQHNVILGSDGTILYLDYGDGYISVCIFKTHRSILQIMLYV